MYLDPPRDYTLLSNFSEDRAHVLMMSMQTVIMLLEGK